MRSPFSDFLKSQRKSKNGVVRISTEATPERIRRGRQIVRQAALDMTEGHISATHPATTYRIGMCLLRMYHKPKERYQAFEDLCTFLAIDTE